MRTPAPRIATILTCLVVGVAGVVAPSPAHAVTKVITAYDANETTRDGWDLQSARIAKRETKYYVRVVWRDGYFDPYRRLVVVRFKAGKRRYAAQMHWTGSSWQGGLYRGSATRPACTPFTRWGNDHRNVTMRFRPRCVGSRVPRWVEGSSVVYTEVGNVADHTPRRYG